MKHQLLDYATLVFDCDGVILDSNKVKTEAFFQATLPYGEAAARSMIDYHIANGGVSRYKKFAHFQQHIVRAESSHRQASDLEALLQTYASHVRKGLLCCSLAPSLEALRKGNPSSVWLIVSGGDQSELRDVFNQRGIFDWFDGGIFGSPDTKDEILARELVSGNIKSPALFLGDSKYDYEAAREAGLDFVFVSSWSEVKNWQHWVQASDITVIDSIACLLSGSHKRGDANH
ncbi:HAD family hydrolase [Polycyclovorans algicola]|uniref:HAD family hydrolase n=1 Tax=Polycyclovorans algicola TaxID=616992 RepID=UPI0009FDAD39|nr:HAD family hydrolase [Polycyclovorans algicola]